MRRLLLFLGGVPALLVLLLLGALELVKSGPVRARVAGALSGALGQPVAIGGLSVSLLPSPALAAREVRIGEANSAAASDSTAAPGLFVPELRVVPELGSLLPGHALVISQVELSHAVIAVRRDSAGGWVLPAMPAPGADGAARNDGGARSVALNQLQLRDGTLRVVDDRLRDARGKPAVASVSAITAAMHAADGRVVIPRFSGRIGKTAVNGAMQMGPEGAELRLSIPSIGSADLPELFALAGMEPNRELVISGKAPLSMTITAPRGAAATRAAGARATAGATMVGKTSIEHVRLGKVPLDALATSFRYEGGVLTLDPLTFTSYRGHQHGTATVDLTHPTARYTLRTAIGGLDVAAALAGLTQMQQMLTGSANVAGNLTGSGKGAAEVEKNLAGTVQLQIANGVVRGLPLLATINRALGLGASSGNDTPFQALHGTARIAGGKAQLSNLSVTSGEMSLAGSGTVDFEHNLDLHLTARLSPAAASAAAGRLALVQKLETSGGALTVPVTVSGTMSSPKIGVDVGALARQQGIQQLQRLLPQGTPQGLQPLLQQLLQKH